MCRQLIYLRAGSHRDTRIGDTRIRYKNYIDPNDIGHTDEISDTVFLVSC